MDTPERSLLRIESKDGAALKRKLLHVDGSEANVGVKSCELNEELNDARYTEMETSDLVKDQVFVAPDDLPKSKFVGHSVKDSVNCKANEGVLSFQSSDAPDTQVESSVLMDESRCEEQEMDFTEAVMNEEKNFPSLAFALAVDGDGEEPVVVISQRRLANHPPYGLVSRAQITIKKNKYSASVLMKEWDSGELCSREDIHNLCNKFIAETKYKFCPGLDPEQYQQEYFDKIRFHIKTVRQTESPFLRVDSVNCALWFLLAPNATATEKSSKEVKCTACKRLVTDLDCQRRRTLSESPGRKLKRQAPSSRARLLYMSPASQQKRKQRTQVERSNDKLKLAKCEAAEIDLDDEQHDEMCRVAETIDETGKDELEKLFAEGDAHGVGGVLKNIWETDYRKQRGQFLHDQATNSKCCLIKQYVYNLLSMFCISMREKGQ